MATIAMKMTFIALLTGAGPVFFCFCFFPPQSFRKNLEGSGGERAVRGGKEAIPTPPFATCVLSFRVECCCLLALQERERVKKKNTVEVCILRMCIIFQRRTSYIRKRRKKRV